MPVRNKHARASAGSILLASKNMKAKISEAVDDATNGAIAEAVKTKDNDRYKKNAVLAAIVLLGQRLARNIQVAVVNGRQEARAFGAVRMAQELTSAGITVSAIDIASHQWSEDESRGNTAGSVLSSAWLSAATFATLRAFREDEDLAKKLGRTKLMMASRAERTADTEVSTAFNSEQSEGLKAAMAADEELAAKIVEAKLGRRWDCLINACGDCSSLDGTIVGIDEDFPGGAEPGWNHVRCRCSSSIVSMAEA